MDQGAERGQTPLFELPPIAAPPPAIPTRPEAARVVRPVRHQVEWAPRDLDSLLAVDHPARAIWALLERLDLAAFYGSIQARLDRPGHPASDPAVLLALWLLGTVEGVGSARKLARLCAAHDAYRWLRGGVPVNYHLLSDFRVAHQAALDDLLTQLIAALLHAGAVTLARVAQDGMRVRASAGASSFRRQDALEGCLAAARTQVQALAQERERPDPWVSTRAQRARERAAREQAARVTQALAVLPQVRAAKERQQATLAQPRRAQVREPRASTTDPEARVMKMPDGGFRPAYNVEFATDRASGIIVGVAVTTEGTAAAQAVPMVAQVHRRTAQQPPAYLVDGGFATRETITTLAPQGTTVYAPVRLPRNKPAAERYAPKPEDPPAVAAWRARMATAEAQTVYKDRAATAEWANAQVRWHGVSRFTVRSLAKVSTVMLLVVLAHNLLRWSALMS
jgi:transposase